MHSAPRLVSRVEVATRDWRGLTAKKMFGGMAWMLHGSMCTSIWHDSLVVRCAPADWPAHLKKKHVRKMDITGRSMKGWLLVDGPAIATAGGLKKWLETSRTGWRKLCRPARNFAVCRAGTVAIRSETRACAGGAGEATDGHHRVSDHPNFRVLQPLSGG